MDLKHLNLFVLIAQAVYNRVSDFQMQPYKLIWWLSSIVKDGLRLFIETHERLQRKIWLHDNFVVVLVSIQYFWQCPTKLLTHLEYDRIHYGFKPQTIQIFTW